MKKETRLIAGVAALCCLFGAYYGLKVYNEKAEEEAAAGGTTILSIDTEKAASVSFYIDGENTVFLYEDGEWTMEGDDTFLADGDMLDTVVSDLALVEAVRTLEEVEDTAEYGMEEPQNVIVYTDTDGNTVTVTIGSTNSGTGNDYIMVDDDESVIYTVSSGLRTAVSGSLEDYEAEEETESETETETETESETETETETETGTETESETEG